MSKPIIYKDFIHDLLLHLPLKEFSNYKVILSSDAKGNTFRPLNYSSIGNYSSLVDECDEDISDDDSIILYPRD